MACLVLKVSRVLLGFLLCGWADLEHWVLAASESLWGWNDVSMAAVGELHFSDTLPDCSGLADLGSKRRFPECKLGEPLPAALMRPYAAAPISSKEGRSLSFPISMSGLIFSLHRLYFKEVDFENFQACQSLVNTHEIFSIITLVPVF